MVIAWQWFARQSDSSCQDRHGKIMVTWHHPTSDASWIVSLLPSECCIIPLLSEIPDSIAMRISAILTHQSGDTPTIWSTVPGSSEDCGNSHSLFLLRQQEQHSLKFKGRSNPRSWVSLMPHSLPKGTAFKSFEWSFQTWNWTRNHHECRWKKRCWRIWMDMVFLGAIAFNRVVTFRKPVCWDWNGSLYVFMGTSAICSFDWLVDGGSSKNPAVGQPCWATLWWRNPFNPWVKPEKKCTV